MEQMRKLDGAFKSGPQLDDSRGSTLLAIRTSQIGRDGK